VQEIFWCGFADALDILSESHLLLALANVMGQSVPRQYVIEIPNHGDLAFRMQNHTNHGLGLVPTAYGNEASRDYDHLRFSTKSGVLFDALEWEELRKVADTLLPGALVLEIGCGTGRFAKRLAISGFRVRAIDPAPKMIEIASAKCRDLDNLTFAQEEGGDLSSEDDTFDLVFAIRVTNQTESEEYALTTIQEMVRVVKSGGVVLVEFVNSNRPFKKKSATVRLSFSQIADFGQASGCQVQSRRGILVFSQTVLDRIPAPLVPAWGIVERLASLLFWRWASRGYISLRKF